MRGGLVAAFLVFLAGAALAQTPGGILRVSHRDSPAHMSIHEEGTISLIAPMMPVFNNLVIYDQHVPQNSLASIRPELATDWSWNQDKTKLTFRLREGVRWHDGKPFTAADVKCTWDLLTDQGKEKFRLNFRAGWYKNLGEVTVNGDREVTFHLKRPQPALLTLLAAGHSPVYPCHVSPAAMRAKPIGTGPFRFVEFKPNEAIRLARNPDYWKPGLPYLDGIEYTIIANRSTALLAFTAGKFDLTFPFEVTVPLLKDVKSQAPQAICELAATNVSVNLLVNRGQPPFDSPEIRRAMAFALDHQAFIDILAEGQGQVGGAMLPPPEGVWGLPAAMLRSLPGYDPDVAKNREAGRAIMRGLGYGPENRLNLKVMTRNIAVYRDPAAILIDQLKQIFIDGELEVIETAIWPARMARKDYSVALNLTGSGVDDPDQQFYENYACGSQRNYTGYCNPALEAEIDRQSMETDQAKRQALVWQIDRQLQEDGARPIIYHGRAATCWWPRLKNLTIMVNSIYNGWRFEDLWLER